MSLDLKSNTHQINLKAVKPTDSSVYEFEDFRLDAAHLMLYRSGAEISLTPKQVETLLALVERSGEIVSKDILMDRLWGNEVVEESNLNQNIYILRKVLGETPDGKPMIETLRRRGYRFNGAAVQPDQIKSLAVLPLENLSGDPAQNYFADGMTETLIAGLAKVGALRVSSRTSVMQYQKTRKPLQDIARELNVDAVVEGSVQRFGERVKITVRLIYMPTGRDLWAETYERNLRDALALQNEIARAVIQQIQIQLTPQEQIRLARAHSVDPTAYDDYLRGRFYANRENKADSETTIRTLERAVSIDPTFASAHAELAQAYIYRSFLFTPEEKELEEKAFMAVEKALTLDPDLAVAYLARGRLLWTPAKHFPHEKAIQEFRRALALNPSLDEAQTWLALVYNHIGLFDQALQQLQKAVTINPISTRAQFRIGQTLLFQGQYEQALSAMCSIPKEGNPRVGYFRALALLHLGRRDEAAVRAEEFIVEYPEDADGGLLTVFHALLAALAGDEKKAEARIKSAIAKGKGFGHFHHTAYDIACAYSLMKKPEPAIKWLQAAADDGFPCYPLFERDPYLDNIRKDSRFIALMANLKKQWEYYRTRLQSTAEASSILCK